jgi:hypothetical protein
MNNIQHGNKQKGFGSLLIISGAIVVFLIVAVIVYVIFQRDPRDGVTSPSVSDIPEGVVKDYKDQPCETQNEIYCHETEDTDKWEDDGLP